MSGGLLLVAFDSAAVGRLMRHAPQRRLHSINDSLGQNVRPSRDGLRGNANDGGSASAGATKEVDGFGLVHVFD
jgi:hypothetical protein